MPEQKTILIIDDEPSLAEMYKIKFEQSGFLVFIASQGKEGLRRAEEQKLDLILLDIMLSDKDGYYVLRKLKKNKQTKDIPVIMLTNLGNDKDCDAALKLGAVEYIIKSEYTPQEVLDICVAKVLGENA